MGVSAEWAAGAGQAVFDVGIVFAPQCFAHAHRRLSSRDAKLFEHFRIRLNEFLHSRLHMVMRHKSELSHIGRSELRFERSRDGICHVIDFRREGLPFIVVRWLEGGSTAASMADVHLFAHARSCHVEIFSWLV